MRRPVVSPLLTAENHARLPRLQLIYRAARTVSVPVTAGIMISMLAFLPLLTLIGRLG
jgi:cobalt-zinc-cadmium resistance protein CzcA